MRLWNHRRVTLDELIPMQIATRVASAAIAATGLVAGFAVAVGTGSRPLGGVVLLACGLSCVAVWLRRDGRRITIQLTAAGLVAFALSHVLGRAIGAWPAVLVVSAATAALCWRLSDSRWLGSRLRSRLPPAGAG
jgi:hypothetical protein